MMQKTLGVATLAALCAAAVGAPAGAQTPVIGSVAAANEEIRGTPPAGAPRTLQLGSAVVAEELVQTGPVGAGQVMFLDRTTLSVWPASEVVLDRFVYDPDVGTGEMALSMGRGLMRFIGGAISKDSDVTIRTPHAVIAVRGGIALIEVGADFTRAVHVAGAYTRINGLTLARSNAAGEAREGQPGQATYLGLLGSDALRAAFTQPIGVGTGGLPVPPAPAAVETLMETTGVTAAGSGRPGAPTAARLSTFGEEEKTPAAQAEETRAATVTVSQQAVVRTSVVESGQVAPVGPTPLPTFVGAQYTLLDDRHIHPSGSDAAARNLTVRATSPTVFNRFTRFAENGTTRVRAEAVAPDGTVNGFFNQTERNGFTDNLSTTFNGEPALANTFAEPGVFYVTAYWLTEPSVAFNGRSLNFFGEPTPPGLWQAVSGADVPVRLYSLSNDAFLRLNDPFSPRIGDVFDGTGGSGVYLIGQPFGPVLGNDADSTAAKWLSSILYIDGAGTSQRTAFGVYTTGAFASTAGAPVAARGGSLIGAARFSSLDAGMRFRVPYGTLDDGAGRTAFGPDGDYLVFGQGGRGDPADPQRLDPAFITGELNGAPVTEVYGDTRLAILDQAYVLPGAQRATLGITGAEAGQPARSGRFLTGGFAATHAASDLNPIYLMATAAAPDVRLRLDPANGSVSAEVAGLNAVTPTPGTPLTGLDLAFGGAGRRSAMLSDGIFGLKDDFDGVGEVTGLTTATPSAALAPPVAGEQMAFVGAMASSGLAGNGGLALANGEPAYLRWGWWSGSVFYDQTQNPRPPETLHLGSWVAGVRTDIADVLAATGTARYEGFALAHVVEQTPGGRAAYVDTGAYRLSYDFGARAGTATITSVLNQTVSGSVTAAGALVGNHYGGDLTGGAATGRVDGAFFRGGGDPLAATAGRFDMQATGLGGGPATAVGIFAAEK